METCPTCQVAWTVCDEECCGGTVYCHVCGVERSELTTETN